MLLFAALLLFRKSKATQKQEGKRRARDWSEWCSSVSEGALHNFTKKAEREEVCNEARRGPVYATLEKEREKCAACAKQRQKEKKNKTEEEEEEEEEEEREKVAETD